MDPQESVWIGPEKYIHWREFNPRTQAVYEIDEAAPFENLCNKPDALHQFWNRTETECGVGCCGVDALRFWPEDITRATQDLDKVALLNQLKNLKGSLVGTSEQVVLSHRLNQLFDKTTFLELIAYLIGEVERTCRD